ncbi:hypothetical protein BGW39_004357 [Mortierella sp. 14UC]|nr:hypothetical protein BGW39_004357 [Mortierella sp. 14UC]
MSAHSSIGTLRTSCSTSDFDLHTTDLDPIKLSRRSSSEDSSTLPHSSTVTATASMTALLSPSSSAQSSTSFTTSASSSVSSSISTSQVPVTATHQHTTSLEYNPSKPAPDSFDAPSTSAKVPSTSPSSARRHTGRDVSRPPSPSASGRASSTATPTGTILHVSPMEPLFFGDYQFPDHPTLQDLLQVFLLDKSSKQKDFHQSLQLHAHLMGLVLSARVSRGLDFAYDHAHDAFKNKQRPDRRTEFVSSYNHSYDETDRILHNCLAHPQPRPSFLDMMSQASSSTILAFLHRLRTDPTILATAFKNLQSQELDTLLLVEKPAQSTHNHSHSGGRSGRERSYGVGSIGHGFQQSASQPQLLPPQQQQQSQQRQQQTASNIPNFVNNQDVVHIIFGNLFGPSSFEREHTLRTRTVVSIFVALLSEKKGERLMVEMLERYVIQSEWQHVSRVKARFEKTLLDLIHKGEWSLSGFSDEELNANMLPFAHGPSQHLHHIHHQHHQSLGRMPSVPVMKVVTTDELVTGVKENGDSAGDSDGRAKFQGGREGTARQAIVEEFYTEACLDILGTLKEFTPPWLLEIARMVFAELDDRAKAYASLIIIVKFFFYRFMNKCIAYPETYGMFQDIFLSEKQRQRILFNTHQRLYRYVTSILNPVPGWESRSSVIDPRIREKIESLVSFFSTPADSTRASSHQYTLSPITELSSPGPVRGPFQQHSGGGETNGPSITPILLLCPADFTTLFYFVCPQLRTAYATPASLASPAHMTRSNSLNGKGMPTTRQRTSSETPPTYPAAMRAAAGLSATTTGSASTAKGTHPPNVARTHKRASPSFSFFGAASSLPFKAKPPQPPPLEKSPSAPAPSETTFSGLTLLSLSGIKPGQAASPRTATVEVTSSAGIAAASSPCPILDLKDPSPSTTTPATHSFISAHSPTDTSSTLQHWADESLIPDLKSAIQELKRVHPGPLKEVPGVAYNPGLTPLREPWALAYVHYEGQQVDATLERSPRSSSGAETSPGRLVEAGLALAPPCMAMVMETTGMTGGSRIITVTKPMLVDQVMDSAGGETFESNIDVDLDVDASDTDSIMSSEDSALAQRSQALSLEDKDMSILRILREFDLFPVDPYEGRYGHQSESTTADVTHENIRSLLLQGVEQARASGNHAAAIGFNHSLQVLSSSQVLRQLDSSKLIYLLAMPIKHRLEHRAKRASSRTLWEGFAHSWHTRIVSAIERKREGLSALRIKMYYLNCVRTSREFEKSFGIVATLSRLNRNMMRKYLTAEEWERLHGIFPGWTDPEPRSAGLRRPGCEVEGCRGACQDHAFQSGYGDISGYSGETGARRAIAKGGYSAQVLRAASKTRRSSFSTYIDNMASRSFGSHSTMESNLGHLKEKEQAVFSTSYNPNGQNLPWANPHAANQLVNSGFLGEAADVQSDFTMDAREVEAVQRWVTDTGIHNFLPGEDNFLRFCMEVEAVVKGVGLGGTGILMPNTQPATQNGPLLPFLANNGSDFFVREVAKFNGQFIVGMGPTETSAQAKSSSSASGVAEFIVNSFKNGSVSSSAPSTNQFFSPAASSANSNYGTIPSSNGSASSAQSSQSSIYSTSGTNTGIRSKGSLRHPFHNNQQSTQETIPILMENPSSIYASLPGPTYALYNPPYSITSHGASASYTSSTAPGGGSSTILPHQLMQLPKDMPEFLRRVQLKLTSFLLSEWLDLFGEVEADRWFLEFLTEMADPEVRDPAGADCCAEEPLSEQDCNEDGVDLRLNQIDLDEKSRVDQCPGEAQTPYRTVNLNENGTKTSTSLHSELHPLASFGSRHSLKASEGLGAEQQRPDSRSSVASRHTQGSSFGSFLHPADQGSPPLAADSRPSSQLSACSEPLVMLNNRPKIDSHERPENAGKCLLNVQVKNLADKRPSKLVPGQASAEPYDMAEAYRTTIDQFNLAKSPYQKLGHLFALEQLIVASLSYPDSCAGGPLPRLFSTSNLQQQQQQEGQPATSHARSSKDKGQADEVPMPPRMLTPGTDAIVDEIERLFRQPDVLRPRHLLRDMQLIATFIPGTILDLRYDGKAFWDMAMAISILKNDVIEYVVEKGMRYVDVEESSRTRQESDRSGSRNIMHDDEERTRMSEAVRLFTIGAKESHQVAQRELAILYMSLPILPSSSSPPIGYAKSDGSPLLTQVSRVPSPVSVGTTRYGRSNTISSTGTGRTNTPPLPPSPKGTLSGSLFGKSSTASIPIKQRSRHQHSNSGSGSSFGSGVLNGLGIITGLGSFTGSSSIGSGNSEGPNNSSTASLLQYQLQHPVATEFGEGHHDVDQQYVDTHHVGRHSTPAGMFMGGSHHNGSMASLHPYHNHHHNQQQQQQYRNQQQHQPGPDKFNPENLAAAMHWFKLAAAQGDKFSINFLKHKETAGGMIGGLG